MAIKITVENRATYEKYLDDARSALHKIKLGKQVVNLGFDGESMSFSPANVNRLERYIAELEAALSGSSNSRPRARKVSF